MCIDIHYVNILTCIFFLLLMLQKTCEYSSYYIFAESFYQSFLQIVNTYVIWLAKYSKQS